MNRQDLINTIASDTKIPREVVDLVVHVMLQRVQKTVIAGEQVRLMGFGIFERVVSAERKGRNPRTGETVLIPPKMRPRFVPMLAFKEKVNVFSLHPKNASHPASKSS